MRRVKCVLCMYADALRTEMLSTLEFRTGSRSSTLALHFGCVFVRMIVCMHDNITTNLIVAPHASPESMEILSFVPARVFSMYVCWWRVLRCVCVCDVCSVEFWGLEKERTHLFHVHLCVCVCLCGISVARLRLFLSVNLNVNVEPIVRDSGSHAQFPMHTAHKVCALSHYVLYLNSNWTSSLDQMFGVGFKIMKFNLFFSRWKVTLWASFWCGPF